MRGLFCYIGLIKQNQADMPFKKLINSPDLLSFVKNPVYLIWTFAHFLLLVLSDYGFEYDPDDFWPLEPEFYHYDISEWLVYMVSPLFLFLILHQFKKNLNY